MGNLKFATTDGRRTDAELAIEKNASALTAKYYYLPYGYFTLPRALALGSRKLIVVHEVPKCAAQRAGAVMETRLTAKRLLALMLKSSRDFRRCRRCGSNK